MPVNTWQIESGIRPEDFRQLVRTGAMREAGAWKDTMETHQHRYLIVNADDFGASRGINRGIVECYRRGIVTSTSLMVTGSALDDAIRLAGENPGLAIGLHWDLVGEGPRDTVLPDPSATGEEFQRQLDVFVERLGRLPTHVDSHRHVHMREPLAAVVRDLVEPLGLPLRGAEPVRFVGRFYAQHEWLRTDLNHVSVPYLLDILETEVGEGWTEIGCHPGYVDPDFESVYHAEREHEIATLTDERVEQYIRRRRIRLTSYANLS